jgi:hypothetical protein
VSAPRLLALALLLAVPAARAAAAEPIDDPKLARRLGARLDAGPAPAESAPGLGPAADVPASASAPAAGSPGGPGPAETVARQPARDDRSEPGVPRFKLGFRRFDFVRVGASDLGSTSGTASSEPFDSVSIDIYPVSSLVRFGLTTQYGWQAGTLNAGGDYFVAQSFSLGAQLARQQVTPFAEAFAGGGYMRRVQFDRTIPTVYWQLGIDAGAEIFVSHDAFFSVALGYLHPVNGFAVTQVSGTTTSASFKSVFVDTWSFKLGVGF